MQGIKPVCADTIIPAKGPSSNVRSQNNPDQIVGIQNAKPMLTKMSKMKNTTINCEIDATRSAEQQSTTQNYLAVVSSAIVSHHWSPGMAVPFLQTHRKENCGQTIKKTTIHGKWHNKSVPMTMKNASTVVIKLAL